MSQATWKHQLGKENFWLCHQKEKEVITEESKEYKQMDSFKWAEYMLRVIPLAIHVNRKKTGLTNNRYNKRIYRINLYTLRQTKTIHTTTYLIHIQPYFTKGAV